MLIMLMMLSSRNRCHADIGIFIEMDQCLDKGEGREGPGSWPYLSKHSIKVFAFHKSIKKPEGSHSLRHRADLLALLDGAKT